jgi:hypothetical protein
MPISRQVFRSTDFLEMGLSYQPEHGVQAKSPFLPAKTAKSPQADRPTHDDERQGAHVSFCSLPGRASVHDADINSGAHGLGQAEGKFGMPRSVTNEVQRRAAR